jgi:hypothetical protein
LDPKHAAKTLSLLSEMTQFMEDVVQSCFLETHSGHPLNVGWINLFQRWVYAPSFQALWPVLRPLFGPDLRYLVEERLRFSAITPYRPAVHVVPLTGVASPGLALSAWLKLGRQFAGQQLFGCNLTLTDGATPHELQIGILAAQLEREVMKWKSGDFYMTPGLWGAGLELVLLDKLIQECRKLQPPTTQFVVMLEDVSHSDRAKRDLRTDLVDLYSAAGFGFTSNNNEMVRN